MTQMKAKTVKHWGLRNLLVALCYALLGWLAHYLSTASGFASVIWFPAGLALGCTLAWGWRILPGVALGALLINTILHAVSGDSAALSLVVGLAITFGVCLQVVLAVRLICQDEDVPLLDRWPEIMRFLLLGGLAAPAISASIGAATLMVAQDKELLQWADVALSWWLGDALGIMLLAPVALSVCISLDDPASIWGKRRISVGLPLLATLLVLTVAFMIVGRFDRDARQAEFDQHATRHAVTLATAFRAALELPLTLRDHFKVSGAFAKRDFEALAARLHIRHPGVRGMVWLPVQPNTSRLTVAYAFPAGLYSHLHGIDFERVPLWRTALDEARENRLLGVSGGSLLPGSSLQDGEALMAFVPVFWSPPDQAEEVLVGVVAAIVPTGGMARKTLPALVSDGVQLSIFDVTEARELGHPLFQTATQHGSQVMLNSTRIEYGSRIIDFVFSAEPGAFSPARVTGNSWFIYLAGLLFSLLLVGVLLAASASAARAEVLVSERTAELERARNEAEKANKLFHEAVGSIAQGFTIYDEQDRLVVCNETYRQMYEASRDLIVPGATFEEIVRRGAERGQYADAIGKVDEWVANRVRQHQAATGKIVEQHLGDGRWLMIVEHRTPSGYIAGNRIDITPLKLATAQLEERNAQLDALFMLSPDGFVAFDGDGLVQFANPAFYRITGLSAGEVVGRDERALEKALLARVERSSAAFRLQEAFTAEAYEQPLLLNLSIPQWRCVQVLGVENTTTTVGRILYFRDVTREVEVSRMKSEFLSHAAHELRTPMTSILGFSELLMLKSFPAEKRQEIIETIHRQTRWLVDIINELLDLARIEARRGKDFNLESLDLRDVVDPVLAGLAFDRTRWPVRWQRPEADFKVMADPAKLRQALLNLISNAQKYSPDGGEIVVTLRTDGGRFGIEVADHGLGMTPNQLASFGERFWRADTSGKTPGTGLGVSIVREIVELHGGSLETTSEPGVGTRVSLWLPAEQMDVHS